MRRVRRLPRAGEEDGSMLIFFTGLVMLVFLVMALGWDVSNYLIGRRAVSNLADGAAIAAANEIRTEAWYASNGTVAVVDERRADAIAQRYLSLEPEDEVDVTGERTSVTTGSGGPAVTVVVSARETTRFLHLLGLVPPLLSASATATSRRITG